MICLRLTWARAARSRMVLRLFRSRGAAWNTDPIHYPLRRPSNAKVRSLIQSRSLKRRVCSTGKGAAVFCRGCRGCSRAPAAPEVLNHCSSKMVIPQNMRMLTREKVVHSFTACRLVWRRAPAAL